VLSRFETMFMVSVKKIVAQHTCKDIGREKPVVVDDKNIRRMHVYGFMFFHNNDENKVVAASSAVSRATSNIERSFASFCCVQFVKHR